MKPPMPMRIRPQRAVVLDERRIRDEIDLRYQSTYDYIKNRFCHENNCKYGGKCGMCPAGELRRYATRDTDRIHELIVEREENLKTIDFLRSRIKELEETIGCQRSMIRTLQGTPPSWEPQSAWIGR